MKKCVRNFEASESPELYERSGLSPEEAEIRGRFIYHDPLEILRVRKSFRIDGGANDRKNEGLQVARVDEDVSIISLDFAQTRPQRRENTIEDKTTFPPFQRC
ncbi:uncharacterized protein LOC105664309 [Megachile rotundata]|uniref:uncharacterized protein LOC105664309 n=1 Tax=Megachile rotundata TaxID=143995 RepID=UPI003FD4B370